MQEQQEDYVVHMQQASKNHLQELRDHFEREVLPDLKTRLERRSEHLQTELDEARKDKSAFDRKIKELMSVNNELQG